MTQRRTVPSTKARKAGKKARKAPRVTKGRATATNARTPARKVKRAPATKPARKPARGTKRKPRSAKVASCEESDDDGPDSGLSSDSDSDADETDIPITMDDDAATGCFGLIVPDDNDSCSLSQDQITDRLGDCVSAGSKGTYASFKNMVVKRGFEWNFNGLISFILNRRTDCLMLANSTIKSIASCFNTSLATQGCTLLPGQKAQLAKAQQMRKNVLPDIGRLKGAMTSERTEIFIKYLATAVKDGRIDSGERELFADSATMLYACALRVFQLRSLQGSGNFAHRNDDPKDLYVTVICKASVQKRGKGERDTEEKQVHPAYSARVNKIVEKRVAGGNTNLFYDFTAHAATKFGQLVDQCAKANKWPIDQKWKGTHMFRNGAAVDAYKESGCLRFVMARTGHLSEKCARDYAMSDMERQQWIDFRRQKRIAQQQQLKKILAAATKDVCAGIAGGKHAVALLKKGSEVPTATRLASDAAARKTIPASPAPPALDAPARSTLDDVSVEALVQHPIFWKAMMSPQAAAAWRTRMAAARQSAIAATLAPVRSDAAVAAEVDALYHPRLSMEQVIIYRELGIPLPDV